MCEDHPGVAGERREQAVLDGRKMHGSSIDVDPASSELDVDWPIARERKPSRPARSRQERCSRQVSEAMHWQRGDAYQATPYRD